MMSGINSGRGKNGETAELSVSDIYQSNHLKMSPKIGELTANSSVIYGKDKENKKLHADSSFLNIIHKNTINETSNDKDSTIWRPF